MIPDDLREAFIQFLDKKRCALVFFILMIFTAIFVYLCIPKDTSQYAEGMKTVEEEAEIISNY